MKESTKFKPGVSGNPKGKPKDKTPATLLRKSIAEAMPEIILTLIEQAKNGDVAAAKCLLDRSVLHSSRKLCRYVCLLMERLPNRATKSSRLLCPDRYRRILAAS